MIYFVDQMVSLFRLTPAFLGLTIGAWGGNIGGNGITFRCGEFQHGC